MFYPSCPNCRSPSKSIEDDSVEYANRHAKHQLGIMASSGHAHPLLQLGTLAITAGRFIYKRVPGGGKKKCTRCGHEFR